MELTWGLILGLLRHVPLEHQETRAGAWQRTVGTGLDGKTIGIIGLGNIGSQMAEVAPRVPHEHPRVEPESHTGTRRSQRRSPRQQG